MNPKRFIGTTLFWLIAALAGPVSVCTEANLPAALSGGLALCASIS
jgi:hypothetical protein